MGKLYTVDHKLLTETPEVRIGDKVYAVDHRQKTVRKMEDVMDDKSLGNFDMMDRVLELALGLKAAKEIDEANYSFAAMQDIFEKVISAMMGEEPEAISARFQESKAAAKE